ncbi:hypothetical protein AOC36_01955 [Erysipelothrix larvae]|uniref:HTH merR-type domain-containing protein n=1 Tax=Erysipelothrix larvae TaxID=1514105 RepID=A0A120JTG4_9FIRM|nr:MerR family transcriptional regulator [Erysipelothrix larvae]AMC92790.1 hypothetical protein AOC36_01955 [Erysipelothrix larvae]
MRIKEVSELLGISSHTLRYYEKVGLMRPVPKNGGGIRDYEEQDVSRLRFIQCMRSADVSIDILKQYIDLFDSPGDTTLQRKALLKDQYEIMQAKYQAMEEGLAYLEHKISLLDTNQLDTKLEESIRK